VANKHCVHVGEPIGQNKKNDKLAARQIYYYLHPVSSSAKEVPSAICSLAAARTKRGSIWQVMGHLQQPWNSIATDCLMVWQPLIVINF
jgi:hypothetical protein